MNLALKAVDKFSKKDSVNAINIVTASYLDPRRYNKFVLVWSYLAALGVFQLMQYKWIYNRSIEWDKRLQKWRKQIEGIDPDNPEEIYDWYTFQEDYLPQSVDKALQTFAETQQNIIPLSIMGSSYVDRVNVVFPDDNSSNKIPTEPYKIARNDGVVQYSVEEISEHMVEMLNNSQRDLVNLDYQSLDAKLKPSWKSRFLMAPDSLPTIQEMQEFEEFNPLEPTQLKYDDQGEKEDEFESYFLEEFLDEIDDHVQNLPSTKQTQKERDDYILGDIEQNRKDIIIQAINDIRTKTPQSS
ncbi:hypothetical protein AKO1_007438 [Acrasis kona]|uniref:ATP synthase F0 subunit 8 n=1 Tax=Acrasis kona TaxID=1008807 RepID=A0AAW2YT68_9EUKA